MNNILSFISYEKNKLTNHSFYINIKSSTLAPEKVLSIAPIMSLFIMNFRDMNRWVIRFKESSCLFKSVINQSTFEDETHSKLFIEDWRKLHFDDKLNWNASDTICWFFLSDETECFRQSAIEFIQLCIDDKQDPMLRFAHTESGEACGNVFFETLSPIAENLAKKRNLTLRFFGGFHLELEKGHVLNSEGVFKHEQLSAKQRDAGIKLAERMFKVFNDINDAFNKYLLTYILKSTTPKPLATRSNVKNEGSDILSNIKKSFNLTTKQPHDSQVKLIEYLEIKKHKISNHPFYNWLLTTPLSAIHKIKRFIPLWVADIMQYRDINKYILMIEKPSSEEDFILNCMFSDLSLHSNLFLEDWITLEMDSLVRWKSSDFMDFLFFDHAMNHHRKTLFELSITGLNIQNNLERFWFIYALESSGTSFFDVTKTLALQAEKDENIKLNYLANRHNMVHKSNVSHNNIIKHFNSFEMNNLDFKRISNTIDFIFSSLEKNLDSSLEAAKENTFAVR